MNIGIPRALLYYDYFPFWKTFFESLGHKVHISKKTNKEILNKGVKTAVDDVCLPVKVYFGHVLDLVGNVDRVFMPRVVSVDKNTFYCPKLFALSDILISSNTISPESIIDIEINFKKGNWHFAKQLMYLSDLLQSPKYQLWSAFQKAKKNQSIYTNKLKEGQLPSELLSQSIDKNRREILERAPEMRIGVFGHTYNVNDDFINMGLINYLSDCNIKAITCEMYTREELKNGLSLLYKPTFWTFGEEILGAVLRQVETREVDGIIIPVAFGCGPDSLIIEICERECAKHNIPLLILTLDEHTGKSGVITRLEAFIDMLRRRKQAI
ncbi:acyl-CoA dehydratase activase-related protein [Natranaerobius thermophilus]|uniref:DUF2229 domain-containing protein n=1 Tax=Natranaerobius thermophilus (strain ATCC BAA-1301 / DSM 18059 / JW/NM-WN-LF) TaxID=457570 RepID=B2A4Y8_NATTJ|nr:acyl-CoA dehydratase activase-related protein [Natranaerobius thermophilus]ACB85230.1 conserved hypothetical protein [Natranaerobius thermophilus JW/NM-WN-LF]